MSDDVLGATEGEIKDENTEPVPDSNGPENEHEHEHGHNCCHPDHISEEKLSDKHARVEYEIVPVSPHRIPFDEKVMEEMWYSEEGFLNLLDQKLSTVPDLNNFKDDILHCVLRQNELDNLKGLEILTKVQKLDLYLNQIEDIDHIGDLKTLIWLDLSFNSIRRPAGLDNLINLRDLYLVKNKITKIENLDHLVNLTQIELGANRIRVIENLDKLTNLTHLWLGKNKITKLAGLDTLQNLILLSLQSNRIEKIENLDSLTSLEQLYLSHNGIKVIEGLKNLKNLKVVDLANNFIDVIQNLEGLDNLEALWLHDNNLTSYDELRCVTSTKLREVYLENNPLQQDPNYQKHLLSIFPTLVEIDGRPLPELLFAQVNRKI